MGSLPVMIWDGGWEWGPVDTEGAEGYWGGILTPRDLGAISWWRLSETSSTYADSIGTATGTLTGSATRGVQGALYPFDTNAAVDLDGSTGYITCGNNHGFGGTVPFSTSAWVYLDAAQDQRVWSKEGSNSGWFMRISATGFVLVQRSNAAGSDYAITDSGVAGTGAWMHLVSTYDGSTIRIYVNGVERASQASTRSMDTNANNLAIGRQINFSGNYLNGKIDEAAIWSRALSADEVLQLYQYSAGTSTSPLNQKPPCYVAFNGKMATNFRSAGWRLGREDWFAPLQPNVARMTFVGSVEAAPKDIVVISTDTGPLWRGYVDTVSTDQTIDGLYITTVTASDVIGAAGRAATNRIDTWTWSGMTLTSLVPYVCNLSGLSGVTVSTADSATSLPVLDGSTVVSGKTALEVISLAERSSNAIIYVKRDGSLGAVVRDAIVAASVTTLSLSGDNAPNGWSTNKGTTNLVNRWRLIKGDGTVVLDERNEASIALYGESVYEVSDYLDSDYPQFPAGTRTAMATPRTVASGTFPVTTLRQDILLLEPLTWVQYEGDTWQIMSVSHDVSSSGWTVSVTADVSQNFMAGAVDPTPEEPPSTLTTVTDTYTSTKSATVFSGGGGNGAGDYLPVGRYDGYLHRALIDFNVTIPTNFDSVKKATLTLTTSGQAWVAFGTSPKFYVRKITESWSEGTFNAAAPSQYSSSNAVDWSNQPDAVSANQVLKSIARTENNEITVDVTDIVQSMYEDGTVQGFKLVSNNEGSTTNTIEFWSDDAGVSTKRPKLTVTCYVTT